MAKKKVNFDFSKMKIFAVTYGEKLALGVAALVMVWFVFSGMTSGLFSASKHPEINKAADQLNARLRNAHPTGKDAKIESPNEPVWGLLANLNQFAGGVWFDPGAAGESKLSNPLILRIPFLVRDEKKKKDVSNFQFDLVRAPAFEYRVALGSVTTLGEGGGQAAATLARYLKGRQMLVVSATFPMKQQLELIRKALRKRTIAELFASEKTRPKWIGLNVRRFEVGPDGEVIQSSGVDLFKPGDAKKVVFVESEIDLLLKNAPFDGQNYSQLNAHLQTGMATPLPALAFGAYPEIKLPGIKQGKAKSGTGVPGEGGNRPTPMGGAEIGGAGGEGFPGGAGGEGFPGRGGAPGFPGNASGAKGGRLGKLSLKKLAKSKPLLAKQLQGDYNPFDPLGRSHADSAKGTNIGTPGIDPNASRRPGPGGDGTPMPGGDVTTAGGDPNEPMGPMGPMGPGQPGATSVSETALVRFLDVSAQPGKAYTYYIQLRLANPNYKKFQAVMYRSQAEKPELVSGWTRTPNISIPSDLEYFVIDREILPRAFQQGVSKFANDRKKTLMQLHHWVKAFKVGGDPSEFGSWAIAPRIYVHRGEYVGRSSVKVPMLEWDVKSGRFKRAVDPGLDRKYVKAKVVNVDFLPRQPAPLVVDFKGGREWDANLGSDSADLKMLVLTSDGRLIQHSRRIDSDPDTQRGHERQVRFDAWMERFRGLQKQATPTQTPGGGRTPTDDCGEEDEE